MPSGGPPTPVEDLLLRFPFWLSPLLYGPGAEKGGGDAADMMCGNLGYDRRLHACLREAVYRSASPVSMVVLFESASVALWGSMVLEVGVLPVFGVAIS